MMLMMGFLLARNLNRSYALFRGKSMPKGQSEENSVELISNEETFGEEQSQKNSLKRGRCDWPDWPPVCTHGLFVVWIF
jgi:hypothetical protein